MRPLSNACIHYIMKTGFHGDKEAKHHMASKFKHSAQPPVATSAQP